MTKDLGRVPAAPGKPKPCLIDPAALVRNLRLCANGVRSFKSDQGDFGICDDAADALEWADWQRRYAIEWANRSVDSVKERMWAVEDGLRALVDYLAQTPHHNAPEAAAARKLLRSEGWTGAGQAWLDAGAPLPNPIHQEKTDAQRG